MAAILAAWVYLFALVLSLYLLFVCRERAWYWHALAAAGALALGFVPSVPGGEAPELDLLLGFAFILLTVWGVGGLVGGHPHREKHA